MTVVLVSNATEAKCFSGKTVKKNTISFSLLQSKEIEVEI